MSRFIINNHAGVSDAKVLSLVLGVVKEGRVSGSGECYCYLSRITHPSTGEIFNIYATRTRGGTDSFTVVVGEVGHE